ncbi:MAG: 50S ribosomal protein L23 [Candidatus Taylorbacteria bacterium]
MALFGSKNKETKAVATKTVVTKAVAKPVVVNNFVATSATSVIIRPHITEKSGILSQGGIYTFVITANANKDSISKAIKTLYKVTPVRIAITNNPAKKVFVRGKRGTVSGIRKAVVTLKKGDKIEFV